MTGTTSVKRPYVPFRSLCLVLLLAALIVFQIADTFWLSLYVWDESRLAVSAIEMVQSGRWFVTTYEFQPDFWNTKPPLAINLMAGSIWIFGPYAFALRLPSVLATCLSVIVTYVLIDRVTRRWQWAVFGALLLATAEISFSEHGGQTADYDSILTLFTTAYAALLFLMLNAERPTLRLALLAGTAFALALLTKSVAGVIPGVGIAIYALVWRRQTLFSNLGKFATVVLIGATVAAAYYALHEAVTPGYLQAVWQYDLGGRFSGAVEEHGGGPLSYFWPLWWRSPLRFFPLLFGIVFIEDRRTRQLAIFSLVQACTIVLIYSAAATKLHWYVIPAIPFLAIALALGTFGLASRIARALRGRSPKWAPLVVYGCVGVLSAYSCAKAIAVRYVRPTAPLQVPPAFDRLLTAPQVATSKTMLTIVDTGVNPSGVGYYAPTLRFYQIAQARLGRPFSTVQTLAKAPRTGLIGSCDRRLLSDLPSAGPIVWQGYGCVLVRGAHRTD